MAKGSIIFRAIRVGGRKRIIPIRINKLKERKLTSTIGATSLGIGVIEGQIKSKKFKFSKIETTGVTTALSGIGSVGIGAAIRKIKPKSGVARSFGRAGKTVAAIGIGVALAPSIIGILSRRKRKR